MSNPEPDRKSSEKAPQAGPLPPKAGHSFVDPSVTVLGPPNGRPPMATITDDDERLLARIGYRQVSDHSLSLATLRIEHLSSAG
jgi:hypothetical protein